MSACGGWDTEPGTLDYIVKDQIAGGSTEPTLANPVTCSGTFIQLYNSGTLHEVCSIILELQRALLEEQRAQCELRKINNPFCLSRFARNNPDRLPMKLNARAEKCEMQLSQEQARISHLRSRLEAKCSGLFACLESHYDQIGHPPPSVRRRGKLTRRQQLMKERNRVIRQYADESASVIGDVLGFSSPPTGP